MRTIVRRPDMARLGPSHSTVPELFLWELLGSHPSAFFNDGSLPGSPDVSIVTRAYRLAVFADGRHWHDPNAAQRHQRPHHVVDWVAKARRNRRRDRRVDRKLRALGFTVLRVWDDAIAKEPLFTGLRVLEMLDRLKTEASKGSPVAWLVRLGARTSTFSRS